MWPSGNATIPSNAAGTTLLADALDDHALSHRQNGTLANNVLTVFGTTPGTNLLANIKAASDQLLASNSGGTLSQVLTKGTINNFVLGTPSLTGGTTINGVYNNGTLGTVQVNGGTIGSAAVLQPLNSAFWAQPGTPQIVGTNQNTQITWGSLKYDLLSEFGTATNNFIAQQAGIYQFTAQLMFNGVATGINAAIRLNGITQQQNAVNPTNPQSLFWQGSVGVGGTVDVNVFNNSSTNPGTMNTSQFYAGFYGKRVF